MTILNIKYLLLSFTLSYLFRLLIHKAKIILYTGVCAFAATVFPIAPVASQCKFTIISKNNWLTTVLYSTDTGPSKFLKSLCSYFHIQTVYIYIYTWTGVRLLGLRWGLLFGFLFSRSSFLHSSDAEKKYNSFLRARQLLLHKTVKKSTC